MDFATALAYMADAIILFTYFAAALKRLPLRWFHWANALGCIPIIITEAAVGAWPALILTAAFGAAGWCGVIGELA